MRDLKNSNIFDLTDDQKIIASVLGYEATREEYLKSVSPQSIPLDMLSFAEETGDKELISQLNETFADSFAAFFNE